MLARPALVAAALLLLALPAAPFVAADHQQPMNPGSDPSYGWVVFDHVKGNEWWVEVKVTSSDGDPSFVAARAESGTFHHLTLQPWGAWAGSFHIPPGERVQFHATREGGMSDLWDVNSCYFTHPAGAEQCPPGATDPFAAAFRPSGNAWWEQVTVSANRPVAGVFLTVDDVSGGRWYALRHESWGGWTMGANAPQGYTVQFYANDGAEAADSPCYRWTTAAVTDCPPSYGPSPMGPFMTRFDDWKGNEWWVEAKVGPVQPTRVLAQDDGGPWVPMAWHADWGTWAASFHVEPGHRVRFQAVFESPSDPTETYASCWFTHPGGFAPDGNQICLHT
jgi:hypothetical protein